MSGMFSMDQSKEMLHETLWYYTSSQGALDYEKLCKLLWALD